MNYAHELPLFVYGTLRLGSRNHGKIEPVVRSAVPAVLPDHALYMDQGPLVRPETGRVVRGVDEVGLYEALVFSCSGTVLRNTSDQ